MTPEISAIHARGVSDGPNRPSHLAAACRSLSRLRKLERLLEVEGSLIRNRFGQQVRHPAHVVAMAEARNFREAMAALQLDIESLYSQDDAREG